MYIKKISPTGNKSGNFNLPQKFLENNFDLLQVEYGMVAYFRFDDSKRHLPYQERLYTPRSPSSSRLMASQADRLRLLRLLFSAIPFSEFDPRTLNPASIRGHIVNAHLKLASVLAAYGVPRGDLEILAYRKAQGLPGFDAKWVVTRTYHFLESNQPVQGIRIFTSITISPFTKDGGFTVSDYHHMLVKTLKYIEQLGLAEVDWGRVEKVVPNARSIPLNLAEDSVDDGFPAYQRMLNRGSLDGRTETFFYFIQSFKGITYGLLDQKNQSRDPAIK